MSRYLKPPSRPIRARQRGDNRSLSYRGQFTGPIARLLRFQQLFRHIARNLYGFGDSATLCYQALNLIRSRKIHAFWQMLDMQIDDFFHANASGSLLWRIIRRCSFGKVNELY